MLTQKSARIHVAQFYRQMALCYDAGLPLERALEVCARQTSSQNLATRARRLSEDLRHGVRLSEAVGRVGTPFTALHAGVIVAAENTGGYDTAFEQLAGWEEKADSLERKIKSVMLYPVMVLSVAALGTVLLLRFLSPLIASAAEQTGGDLSVATRLVLWLGQTIWTWQFCLGLAVAAVVLTWAAIRLSRMPQARLFWERWSLRLPLLGKLLRKAWLIRLARCLNSLLRAGLPMVRCIELAATATGNGYLGEHVLQEAAFGVRKGERLSQALPPQQLSRAFIGMMSVGETTGHLPDMLGRVADLHEIELSNDIEALMRGIEPVVIAGVGLVVLLVLVAALQPLYALIINL